MGKKPQETDYNRRNNPDYSEAQASRRGWGLGLLVAAAVDLEAASLEFITGHYVASGVTLGIGAVAIVGGGVWADRTIGRLEHNAEETNRQHMAALGARPINSYQPPTDAS